jgi:3-phenylpropionate/trans-cinnamate dioxygenase ferredoxin reductase subunit
VSHAGVVIVGAGQGGVQAAISLRQEGYSDPITLIGAEPGLPYQRPPLSKAFLKTGEAEKLVLRPADFYSKKSITLRSSVTVDRIDRKSRKIYIGVETLPYDHLILATGTRNLVPPIAGVRGANGLRTLADAQALRARLSAPTRIAVIGGGFIGLEFAAVAAFLGHQVHVAEAAPRLIARVLSPEMSEAFFRKHKDIGTHLHLGRGVTEVTEGSILLSDGTRIAADLVLLAAGVRPNVELAQDAGLTIANGIKVDAFLRTQDANIFALGDCAAFPDPRTGARIRLEIAKTITGTATPYRAVPWFWSDQADWKLQIAGLAGPDDDAVRVDDQVILRFADGMLSAVETVNNAKVHMKARKLLAGSSPLTRDMLAAKDYDLTIV